MDKKQDIIQLDGFTIPICKNATLKDVVFLIISKGKNKRRILSIQRIPQAHQEQVVWHIIFDRQD